MEFSKKYRTYQIAVEKEMKTAVSKKELIYNPIRYVLTAGGKRLRPIITLFSCEAVGGKYKSALSAAAAIEMLHTFTLIHDDIMDNAEKRRGLTTIHEKWNTATAILSGDLLAGVAFRTLLNTEKKNRIEAAEVFTKSYIEVCEGQDLDMDFASRSNVTMNQYYQMIEKKTASLIAAAAQIGGIVGNGTSGECNSLKKFGLYLGIAFQIHDDLLDVEGDSKLLGKPAGQDIIEGKKNYLLLKGLEIAKGKDSALLNKVADHKTINKTDVEKVKNTYSQLGVLKCAKEEIKLHIDKANMELLKLPKSEARSMLEWIANNNLVREN
jgi:geranylgeranyl diphosphate synthase type II